MKKTNIIKLLILIFIVLVFHNCSNKIDKVKQFYDKNKNNKDIFLFENVMIYPARQFYLIRLSGDKETFLISDFDKVKKKVIVHRSEYSFITMKKEYGWDRIRVINYLSELFSIYNDLDIILINGMPNGVCFSFTIDPNNKLVFVPNWEKLNDWERNYLNSLKEKKNFIQFDKHWFTYQLDKPDDSW